MVQYVPGYDGRHSGCYRSTQDLGVIEKSYWKKSFLKGELEEKQKELGRRVY